MANFMFVVFLALVVRSRSESQSSEEDDDDDLEMHYGGDRLQTAFIEKSFSDRRTFQCQLVKSVLRTGDNGATISPEDISVIGGMGDALTTGIGLWGGAQIEFRGAAFTLGGDATIDGLVTFPNILQQFSSEIRGISHGMGTADQLPSNQFNVAATNAESDDMDRQADELVHRLYEHFSEDYLSKHWTLVFITIGTEEMCKKCDEPNVDRLRSAIVKLKRAIPKILVVLIGPVHVAKSKHLNYNLLKPRCKCLDKLTHHELGLIQKKWSQEFMKLEAEFASRNYTTFTLLVIPNLIIESRNPEQLFIQGRPLLNRKGHTYAAKWLWNRMIAGPKYNASLVPLSEDSYYCPPVACPYFHTPANYENCKIMTLDEYNRLEKLQATVSPSNKSSDKVTIRRHDMSQHIVFWVAAPVILSAVSVTILGTYFYCHGMRATKGRFENIPGV